MKKKNNHNPERTCKKPNQMNGKCKSQFASTRGGIRIYKQMARKKRRDHLKHTDKI